jgi:hypothetical protein
MASLQGELMAEHRFSFACFKGEEKPTGIYELYTGGKINRNFNMDLN